MSINEGKFVIGIIGMLVLIWQLIFPNIGRIIIGMFLIMWSCYLPTELNNANMEVDE